MPSNFDSTMSGQLTTPNVPTDKSTFKTQFDTLKAELEHGGFLTNPTTASESTAETALANIWTALQSVPQDAAEIAALSRDWGSLGVQTLDQAIAEAATLPAPQTASAIAALSHDWGSLGTQSLSDAIAEAATLPTPGGGTGLTVVNNVAALKAILPDTAGKTVLVLGHTTPGDGGGGLFRADVGGALQTDGGIVFAATADESAEQAVTGKGNTTFGAGFALPHANLIFGSVVIDPESTATALTFPDSALHGHRLRTDGYGIFPLIDHKAGAVSADPQNRISGYLANATYTEGVTTATVRYKYATNARRWVRVHDGRIMDVRWFGVTEGSADQRDAICWALTTAKRLGFTEARLNGSYRYHGPIEIPNGVAFGWGKLTVTTGDAIEHLRTNWDTLYPDSTVRRVLRGTETSISFEDNSPSWIVRNLELDGDYSDPAKIAVLEDISTHTLEGGVISVLENTPTWGGLNCNVHGNRVVPFPQYGVLEDVDIHGFGSNCLLGHGNVHIHGRNVRLGDSTNNHVFYGIHGVFDNMTVYGFARGGYGKTEFCKFNGLNFLDLREYDFTPDGWSLAVNFLTYEGFRWQTGAAFTGGAADRWQNDGLVINGGRWDVDRPTAGTNSPGPLITGSGQHLDVSNVTVFGPVTTAATGLAFLQHVDQSDTEFKMHWALRNVSIFDRGKPCVITGNHDLKGGLIVENVTVQPFRGYQGVGAAQSRVTRLDVQAPRSAPNAALPRRVAIRGWQNVSPLQNIVTVDVSDLTGEQIELVIQDSTFVLDPAFGGNAVIRNEAGTGTIAGTGRTEAQMVSKIRAYLDRVRFTLTGSNLANAELLFALSRLQDCATLTDGYRSEAGGLYIATGSEGTNPTIILGTGLMWAPRLVFIEIDTASATGATAQMRDNADAGALSAAIDKRNPKIAITFTGSLTNGDVIRWRAAVGGPNDGTFYQDAIPVLIGA